jgi:hypothetical protein
VKCEQINTFLTRKTHPQKKSALNIIPFFVQHETPHKFLTIIEFEGNKFMDEICYYCCTYFVKLVTRLGYWIVG